MSARVARRPVWAEGLRGPRACSSRCLSSLAAMSQCRLARPLWRYTDEAAPAWPKGLCGPPKACARLSLSELVRLVMS